MLRLARLDTVRSSTEVFGEVRERLGRIESLLNQLTNESELRPHASDADLG